MADITGSAVNDTLDGTALADTLTALAGSDLVQAGDGNDTLYANTGIVADNAADTLYGGLGDDTLHGHSNDLLNGDGGNDTFNLGSDTDYSVVGASPAVILQVTVSGGDGDDDIGTAFEWSPWGVVFNMLEASTLDGGAGNDSISAGAQDTLILGGDGNDWIWLEETRYYPTGNNTVDAGAGNDIIFMHAQSCIVTGGGGLDALVLSFYPILGAGSATPAANVTDFTPGEDFIVTSNLRAEIGQGDQITGDLFAWNALRFQQQGNDGVLQYNHTFASTGETTPDTATYPWLDLLVLENTNLWDLAASAHASHVLTQDIYGTPDTSLAALAISANTLGTAAAETWSGNIWRDTLNGAGGNDTLRGLAGNDLLIGDNGNDLLNGGGGADALRGGNGADTLLGGAGNDTLSGAVGNDVLTGGSGRDLFSFTTSLSSGPVDRITDFATGTDTVAVLRSLTNITAGGRLADAEFRAGNQALDADDRFIYDIGSGALYYDADGNGAVIQVKFAQLDDGGTTLVAQDILLN